MTNRKELLQVARLSTRSLSEVTGLLEDFVAGRLHEDGGFVDRGGRPDLYYTVFGLACMEALMMEIPCKRIAPWLARFGDGTNLDLVHLCALARSWCAIGKPNPHTDAMTAHLLSYRTPDGGFNAERGAEHATTYGNFLVLAALQDLDRLDALTAPQMLAATCTALRSRDGGFANEPDMPVGNTPAVAAAEFVMRTVGDGPPRNAASWLLEKSYGAGGFFAIPAAPMPDLLSTATALHALSGMGVGIDPIREDCLDFVDSLWVNRGGFFGNWGDDKLDLEYTFYGLLALGHLSL